MSISLNQRYAELLATKGAHEYILKFVGVPKSDGGYFKKPMNDPDYDYQIPMLRKYFIAPNKMQQRMEQLISEGWVPYEPEPEPANVKKVTTAIAAEPDPEPKPKRKTRTRRTKKNTDDVESDK